MLNPPADLISPCSGIFARFDVASFYDSIDHATLLSQLEDTATPLPTIAVVSHNLTKPDITHTGVGLCAGGSISPLLGALYLKPLDDAFFDRDGIFYLRYMDDVVILAKTRWKLRRAIRLVHHILNELKMQVHETKRFNGRTIQGFDFLGYTIHPFRRLRPSDESIRRLQERARRFYEQGVTIERLWQYVFKWCQWLWGGVYAGVRIVIPFLIKDIRIEDSVSYSSGVRRIRSIGILYCFIIRYSAGLIRFLRCNESRF